MKIKKEVIEQLIAHAKKEAPQEACGYLAGQKDIVLRHFELTNIDKASDHFRFDPKEQFQAMRETRSLGQEVYAVYHSHPETLARPSEEDIKLAYDPNLSYVIVSLANGAHDVKAYKIKGLQVTREDLEVV
jgi:proteasome lid subunit RPN8/RPN11